MSIGTLYGVGVGPGDPELVTVKAARLISNADVIAYHSARHGRSLARQIADPHVSGNAIEEPLVYPVTTESTDHPDGYQGAIEEFYTQAAARLATHLDAGRDVVLLAEGDPLFYGSYMHMHKRLADHYPAQVIPGVTSISAAAAVLGTPLVEHDEVLTVLPGTLPRHVLASRIATTDAAVVIKLGRTFTGVREALADAGRIDEAHYVERATMPGERRDRVEAVDPESVPYFSLAVVPGALQARAPKATPVTDRGTRGEVAVVGTGPAGAQWLTPQTAAVLFAADDLVGYGPYLQRVPANPHQARHASGNRQEAERAAYALDLAATGRSVAVVSAGDPGVFAMAAAVLEVAADPRYSQIEVRVFPGVTAAQAVAAAAGAPLGHDHAVISLSDRLKPWKVVLARLGAAAAADLVIAIYNPRSQARPWQLGAARDLLLEHRAPDTPVVVGRDVGGPDEHVAITTLAGLDPEHVDMRTLLIVGSSTTRALGSGPRHCVVTPRHYQR